MQNQYKESKFVLRKYFHLLSKHKLLVRKIRHKYKIRDILIGFNFTIYCLSFAKLVYM
jgi:hypothetical protein